MQYDHRSTKPDVGGSTPPGRASIGPHSGKSPPWPLSVMDIARFALNIDASAGPDACHPWQGTKSDGYGVVRVRGRMIRAHRVALMLKLGRPLRDGELTRHSPRCTTTLCCNQRHLSGGNQADNGRDRTERGTRSRRLTPDLVIEARQRHAAGQSCSAIASDMGFFVGPIRCAVSRRTWASVPDLATQAVSQ